MIEAGSNLSLPQRVRWLEEAAAAARYLATDRGATEVAEPGPSPNLTLLDLLAGPGGATLERRWSDPTLAAALLGLSDGSRLIVVERTYREGIKVLRDPTDAECAAADAGRLWDLWNADRAVWLAGAI